MKTSLANQQADRRTRERVAGLLLERGQQTAAALADELGLTAAGVRRHLDAMLAEGSIVAREQRVYGSRGRGRPAKVFALSEAGHAAGPSAYDEIAADALHFLAETAGEQAVEQWARRRVNDFEQRYAAQVAHLPLEDRPAALAEALSADGYAATTHDGGIGVQLCQHHCPVQHVAEQFPQLCEAETAAFGRLTGRHVQRLATIAHGDGVCTTHIPLAVLPPVPSERKPE
ncbi:MAG: helix-turn-helix transcriptional regulator [Actinomycetes bacterium]